MFKAPLKKLDDMENIETVIRTALDLESQYPIHSLLKLAQTQKGIELTQRQESPYKQLYAGQNLGFEESP